MNVVLIEDEQLVTEDLSNMLCSIDGTMVIRQTLHSVKQAISFLRNDTGTHLIFSDIQLGDGYSFEIFKELHTRIPVIYCTAFNEHALKAFENNGIAYILKPYSRTTIKQALDKYKSLKENFSPSPDVDYDKLIAAITGQATRPQTLLVNFKNRIIPVKTTDVAFFGFENKTAYLLHACGEKYALSFSLEELETQCGPSFFRASRQLLINKSFIKDIQHYSYRKLFISLTVDGAPEILINKHKIPEFLQWLKQ